MSKEQETPQANSEEVDLGQLFKMIGKSFDRFFKFIISLLNKLVLAVVWMIFFVKKHIIKLILAGVIGFAFGFFKKKFSKPSFTSSIIIKQNYPFGETLYNAINYYQGLVEDSDNIALAEVLDIDPSYASSIISIEIKELISNNDRFIEFNNYTKRLDSTLASGVDYSDYLDNVEAHVYSKQLLSINSKSNDNFEEVFEALIKSLNTNVFLARERDKDIRQLENRELAIKEALVKSDSLQEMYKKILEFESQLKNEKTSQTSITIEGSDEASKTKEFDLFKNDIELRKELVSIEREKEDKEFIVEILSRTPSKGFIDSSFEILGFTISQLLFFTLLFPIILFLVLSILRFFKYLEKYNIEA